MLALQNCARRVPHSAACAAADDIDEMVAAVKHAVQHCCIQVHASSISHASQTAAFDTDDKVKRRIRPTLTISALAAQLRVKVVKALAAREQQARKRNLTKYIPNAAQAIYTVNIGHADPGLHRLFTTS